MKDILIKKLGILDFAVGSPRETLQQAFANRLIDDDQWLQMLKPVTTWHTTMMVLLQLRNFRIIINIYYPLFEKFKVAAEKYYR